MTCDGYTDQAPVGDVADLAFWLLGSFTVTSRGEEISLSERRQRLLLLFLERANRTVPSEDIIERIWPQYPLERGRRLLHTYVWALRRVLDPRRQGLIRHMPTGYRMVVEDHQIDARRFLALARVGQEQLHAGRVEAARGALRAALELWRAGLTALFVEDPTLAPFATRLRSARAGAVEAYNTARLLLGEHRAMLVELEQLVSEQPRNEVLVGQLMLAHYRSGHQTAALDAFATCSDALAERGLLPGPDLRSVEVGILRHEPWVKAPGGLPASTAPVVRQITVVGAARVPDDPPSLAYPRRAEIDLLATNAGGYPAEPARRPATAAFGDVAAAVRWAQALQTAIVRRDGLGIGVGLWIVPSETWPLSSCTHGAADQLAETAQPGQVLLSGEVPSFAEQVPAHLELRRLGPEALKRSGLDASAPVVEVGTPPGR